MEVSGKIIAVAPLQTGESAKGPWKKQDYVIEYDSNSQYPRKMVFNLWGDKIDQNNVLLGQSYRVSFDIEAREYNGKWFNDVRAWKIESMEAAAPPPPVVPPQDVKFMPDVQIIGGDPTSDMPF